MSIEGFRLNFSLGCKGEDMMCSSSLDAPAGGSTSSDFEEQSSLDNSCGKWHFDIQMNHVNNEESKTSSTSSHVQQLLQLWRYYMNSKITPIELHVVQNIASEICSLLLKTKSDEALSVFLSNLPDVLDGDNENIIRARIHVALHNKDTKTVKKLLQDNHFSYGKQDLIKTWDQALYLDEEKRTGKKLTALTRFRVRKRYPPPPTICINGVRKTSALPRESTSYLKTWLLNHLHDPYPSAMEKQQLAKMSGLSTRQVKTWFANARRRSKTTDEFRKRCEESEPQMKISNSLRSNRRGTDSPHIPSINCNNIGEFEGFAFMPYEEQINNNHVEAWRVTNNVDPTNYASSFLWHSYGPKEYVRNQNHYQTYQQVPY